MDPRVGPHVHQGSHADDTAADAFILAQKVDTLGTGGGGTPNSFTYYNTTTNKTRFRHDGAWEDGGGGGGGGAVLTGVWKFDTSTATGPASGRFRQDDAVYANVTELFISEETNDGFDATNILAALSAGDRFYIQRTDGADEWAVWDVMDPVVDEGDWFRVPVTLVANGLALTNNRDASITVLFNGNGFGVTSHEFLNLGAATDAVDPGDLAAHTSASGGLFYDADAMLLSLGGNLDVGGDAQVDGTVTVGDGTDDDGLVRFYDGGVLVFQIGWDESEGRLVISGPALETDDVIRIAPGGALTLVTNLILTPEAITATNAGVAASLDTVNTEVTTNLDGDLDNVTLADGTPGQKKNIYCKVSQAGDTWKVTPATMLGGTQITFGDNSVGRGCTLVFTASGWVVIGNNGGTIT
jgi:hypothetical protein